MGWSALGQDALPDRFRIDRELGRGGMGVVYAAHDTERGHLVALKTIARPTAEALYRLKKEFRALADLSHPNLVVLYDLVVTDKCSFYTMELVDGPNFVRYCRLGAHRERDLDTQSLPATASDRHFDTGDAPQAVSDFADPETTPTTITREVVEQLPRYDEDRLRAALAQLVAGVHALHRAGKVHRDIKPSNVLVTRDGRVVLLDFGLVTTAAEADGDSLQGSLVGTVSYMSPEQAARSSVTGPAADWYSVGVLLYRVLTGTLPHAGDISDILGAKGTQQILRPQALVSSVPDDLDELCVRLLAPDPDRRPSGAEVANAVAASGASLRAPETPGAAGTLFTGRRRELDALEKNLATVREGTSSLVIVRGASGIGKSALVAEFLRRVEASHPDAVVLRGRCYERELVPFKAIDGLIDGLSRVWRNLPEADAVSLLPRAASSLPRLFPVLGRVPAIADAPVLRESPDPVEARGQAFSALREVFQRLADRQPLILFLDDMHWVDLDTVTLLGEIMRAPDPPAALVVLAARSDGSTTALDRLRETAGGVCHTVELGPLLDDEASALVEKLVGEADERVAERAVREAAGSPFFLAELARYLHTIRAPGDEHRALSLDDVLRQRIASLPEHARRLLEVVAVAGEPVRERDAAAAMAQPSIAHELRLLRIEHLLRHSSGGDERIEPYHDRIREATVAALSSRRRRELHRALALALEGHAPAARLARHWAGAGDDERAAAYARKAADQVAATFDFEQASELYRMARELGSFRGVERRELTVAHANALLNAGRCAAAAEAFLEAAVDATPLERLVRQRRAAEQFLIAGLISRGLEVLGQVLEDIHESMPRTPRRALVAYVWALLRLRLRGYRWRPRDEGEIPPRHLLRLDVYVAVGRSLAMVDTIRGGLFQARGLRLALKVGEPRRVFQCLTLHGIFLAAQGGAGQRKAGRLIEMLAEHARRHPDPLFDAYLHGIRGFHAYFVGEFRRANEELERAETGFRDETTDTGSELNNSRIFRTQCLRYYGAYAELRERFDAYMRDARHRGDHYVQTTLARAINIVWLADDDVDAARAALGETWWSPPEDAYHLQHWYELRASCELALYAAADRGEIDPRDEDFQRLRSSLLTRIQTVRAESSWLRGRLALVTGRGPSPARLARALERENNPFCDVWAALLRAGAESGDDAEQAWRRALQCATDRDMPLCAHAARRRLGEALGGAEGTALVDEADAWMHANGIANPERMTRLLAPVARVSTV